MAKEIRPWYRWWWHEYRTSNRVLAFGSTCVEHPFKSVERCSLAFHGAYRNLLDAMWELNGALPNNRAILWRLALAASREEYEIVADEVEAMFQPSEDGSFLTNDRLCAEWEDCDNFLEAKRKAGKASAEARRKSTQSQQPSTPVEQKGTEAQQEVSTPSTSSSSSSSSSKIRVPKPPDPMTFNSTEAAKAYCDTFLVAGEKNINLIRESIETALKKWADGTAEEIADSMIQTRRNYLSLTGKEFTYEPVPFITSGAWRNPDGWKKERQSDRDAAVGGRY